MRVDIWSDIVCPWCYVGKRRFEKALGRFEHGGDVRVVHHAFQLNPAAPRHETSSRREMLMRKYLRSPQQAIEMDAGMTETAAAEGLIFHLDGTLTGNTLDAHQLVHLGLERGLQDAVVERLFRAYFTEQRSVFDPASLVQLAIDAGLDPEEAAATLRENRYADAVIADIDVARRLGVTGVPFFVFDERYGVSGAQPPDVFVDVFERTHQSVGA
jgi:predicted DsbA family dithiol-disulfide isomerase